MRSGAARQSPDGPPLTTKESEFQVIKRNDITPPGVPADVPADITPAGAVEIRARIEKIEKDKYYSCEEYTDLDPEVRQLGDAIRAVLDLHKPFRIYYECGHDHTEEDIQAGRAVDINDVGITCNDGYMYSICEACCCTDEPSQTEDCVSDHSHGVGELICPTVRVVAEAMGIDGGAR